MTSVTIEYNILWPALIAGLLVTATHVPLGIQVLNRGIVFIDLATPEISKVSRPVSPRLWALSPALNCRGRMPMPTRLERWMRS